VNQKQALTKLGKLIGRQLAYRIDNKAPGPEERERRREAFLAAKAEAERTEAARVARLNEVLAADAEYQRLKAAAKAAADRRESMPSYRHKRITVGRQGSMFFTILADGDNWAEVVEKIEADKAAP
jgi:hypothetical protein